MSFYIFLYQNLHVESARSHQNQTDLFLIAKHFNYKHCVLVFFSLSVIHVFGLMRRIDWKLTVVSLIWCAQNIQNWYSTDLATVYARTSYISTVHRWVTSVQYISKFRGNWRNHQFVISRIGYKKNDNFYA